MCETDEFKPITDTKIKELLKNIVRNCIDLEINPYYDFKDSYIKNSGFDFCMVKSEFLSLGEEEDNEYFSINLYKYCIENNYKELFAINTEFIDTEELIYCSDDFPWSLAYRFIVGKDSFLSMRSNFDYGSSALLFPEDLSFFILMKDSYDVIAGKKEFIETIVNNDIVKEIESLEDKYFSEHMKPLLRKYKNLIHAKYG